MKKFAALLSYDGTLFCGWQRQEGPAATQIPSIQETFDIALETITRERVRSVGSGRTDSGVHAVGQVVHFVLSRKEWESEKLQMGLNSLLPKAIRVRQVSAVDLDFHAQRSALKKQYSYYFQQGPCDLPAVGRASYWIRKKLDLDSMHRASQVLIGEHDFLPFRAAGAPHRTTIRRILEAEVTWQPLQFPDAQKGCGFARFRVVGTGFLKQMVRGIAGTLLQIGEGKRPEGDLLEILETKDRKRVGTTAPGRGLWLEKVWYENGFGD